MRKLLPGLIAVVSLVGAKVETADALPPLEGGPGGDILTFEQCVNEADIHLYSFNFSGLVSVAERAPAGQASEVTAQFAFRYTTDFLKDVANEFKSATGVILCTPNYRGEYGCNRRCTTK